MRCMLVFILDMLGHTSLGCVWVREPLLLTLGWMVKESRISFEATVWAQCLVLWARRQGRPSPWWSQASPRAGSGSC